jgi:hypothetical protein
VTCRPIELKRGSQALALGLHASRLSNELATCALQVVHLGMGNAVSNTIIGLLLLALAVAGAWRWYEAQSKNQKMETAAQDVRETAECHLEAFKLRPGLMETDWKFRPRSWTFVWRR